MIVATANSLADLSGSTVAPTDWNGFSFIARIVSTSSSDSVFTKQKPIATMGVSGRRSMVTAMGPITCQPFHTVRTPSCEWQVAKRVCQSLVLCGFVWQSSCPWHVHFTNRFCWWCIIISWILILQWTQLRQRCRTDVVHTIGFVQMCHSPVLTQRVSLLISHLNSKPFSQQDDSHSGLDGGQEAIRTWLSH